MYADYRQCLLSFFFFSSRRRHTRYIGDWSSDVCSSDLVVHNCSKRKSGPRTNLFLLPKQPELGRAARTLEWCLFLGGLAAFAVAGLRCLGVLWLPGESDGGRGADR